MNEMYLNKNLRKVVIFSVSIISILILAGGILVHIFKHTLNNAMEVHMQQEVGNYKQRVINQINQNFNLLNTMSRLVSKTELENEKGLEQILEEADAQNEFLMLGYYNNNEKVMLVSTSQDVSMEVDLKDIQPEVQSIIERVNKGERVISDVIEGEITNEKVFIFGVPVYCQKQYEGVLLASEEIEIFLEEEKEQEQFYGSGYIHLLDSEGKFIVRGNEAAVKENMESVLEKPYLSDANVQNVRNAMEQGEDVKFEFQYENLKYSAILEPVGINGWYLFCVNSMENVNKNIYSIMYATATFFLVTVVILFCAVCYAFVFMRRINQQLRKLAYYDELTGIYNMRHFTDLAEEAAGKRNGFAIVVLNVRQFKFINEFFRKEQADKLLQHIGAVLHDSIRKNEYVCRESADYFYLFLRDTDHEIIENRLSEIDRKIMHAENGQYGNRRIVMRYGIATSDSGTDFRDVMTQAMFALAKTKENQKKDMWFFDSVLHEQEQMDNYMENHAMEAMDKNEFSLFLQPKIRLQDGSLSGAEALVRWIQLDGNIIYPNSFIPLFEANGFCTHLDMYMFERVCKQLRTWIDAGYDPIPISINQSKRTFYEKDYEGRLCECLDKYQIPASLITLEILESFVFEKVDEMNLRLDKLREIGFHISLDDFGTGYSSLNTFGRLKIDELKMDRGFLLEAKENIGHTRLILEEIVELSKKLQISTVIEGVETSEQEQFVKEIGCDIAQGYLYSKPVDAEYFTEHILLQEKQEKHG